MANSFGSFAPLIHLGIGIASGYNERLGVPASASFITYQVIENEPKTDSIGDVCIFGTGFLIGKLLTQR